MFFDVFIPSLQNRNRNTTYRVYENIIYGILLIGFFDKYWKYNKKKRRNIYSFQIFLRFSYPKNSLFMYLKTQLG